MPKAIVLCQISSYMIIAKREFPWIDKDTIIAMAILHFVNLKLGRAKKVADKIFNDSKD